MNPMFKNAMAEATRLTRDGRLGDAMEAVRRALSRKPAQSSAVQEGPPPGAARPGTPVIDLDPPSDGKGAWTAPEADRPRPEASVRTGLGQTGLGQTGLGQTGVEDVVRELLDRVGRPGPLSGFRGRAEPAPPPAPLPEGARFEERVFANGAGRRTYKLYVPGRSRGQAMSLVVMLHGCTQSPDDFAAGTRMNELAEEQGFLVAYPAQSKQANVSKCWNWFSVPDQQRDQGEPFLIAGITRQIMEEFPVEPGRVYVAGLSAGGAAAAIMGATYPDLYAAVGVHSGLACGAARDVASAFAAMRQGGEPQGGTGRPVPTIVFHGDRDATVHPVNGDHVIAQARADVDLGVSVESGRSPGGVSYTRTVQSDRTGRPMLEQWVLHGAGHAWSGGSAAGTYTDPRGPDASREMLRFFGEHATS